MALKSVVILCRTFSDLVVKVVTRAPHELLWYPNTRKYLEENRRSFVTVSAVNVVNLSRDLANFP